MTIEHTFERKVLITREQIQNRVKELAEKISEDYREKNLLLVGILKGATFFTADLMRQLWMLGLTDAEVDFMKVSSYGDKVESSGSPSILLDLNTDITGRHVLVVEDIVDTGYTLEALREILGKRGASSVQTCALLDKAERRRVQVPIEYVGFVIPDVWVDGYGIDTKQSGRGAPDVLYVVSSK